MIKQLLTIALLLISYTANATRFAPPPPIETRIKNAELIVVATVAKVQMINSQGKELTDPKSRTGPGSGNLITYHLDIKPDDVLKGKLPASTNKLVYALNGMFHTSLASNLGTYNAKLLFVMKKMKGSNMYQAIYPGSGTEAIGERSAYEKILGIKAKEMYITNQHDLNEMANDLALSADKKLNKAYQALKNKIKHCDARDPSAYQQYNTYLRDAQRAWIKFRDEECGFAAEHLSGGQAYWMEFAGCKEGLSVIRTKELIANFRHFLDTHSCDN